MTSNTIVISRTKENIKEYFVMILPYLLLKKTQAVLKTLNNEKLNFELSRNQIHEACKEDYNLKSRFNLFFLSTLSLIDFNQEGTKKYFRLSDIGYQMLDLCEKNKIIEPLKNKRSLIEESQKVIKDYDGNNQLINSALENIVNSDIHKKIILSLIPHSESSSKPIVKHYHEVVQPINDLYHLGFLIKNRVDEDFEFSLNNSNLFKTIFK